MSNKKEECLACIGFSNDHTCKEWAQFEELARRKEGLPSEAGELRAQLDRLREAVEFIAEAHDAGRHDGLP